MKGLLIKDFLNLKKSFTTVFLIMILYFIFALNSGDPSLLVGMIVILLTMMGITSISYDDLAKWEKFALAMPISRRSLVYSKYILSILLSLMGLVLSSAVGYLIVIFKGSMSMTDFFLSAYFIFSVGIIFTCIMLPLVFKFGVERVRLMMVTIIAIPTALVYALSQMGVAMPTEAQFMTLIKFLPLILLLSLYISSTIAIRIYSKKDF